MEKIYHYTSFETFKKIIETRSLRFNSLVNVDDAQEGVLLDCASQAPYTYVSCWTKDDSENIPLWKMYVDSPFAVRIGVYPSILKPQFFKRHFVSNHNNRNAYVFLIHRGGDRGSEFLSDIVYKEQPYIQMLKNFNGMITEDYIQNYGLSKSRHWEFQKEVRFVIQAVPLSRIKHRPDASLIVLCQEVVINNDPTDITHIDMFYELSVMLKCEIMLGPSTTKENEQELRGYLKEKLPDFSGSICRSDVYIRAN